MFGHPGSAYSVYVTIVPAGCCKSEFDTSYPVHLHGIIHPEEYANSIRNINQAMSFKKAKIVCTVIFSVCVISAISLCVAGDLTSTQSQRTNWRVMAPIGACLFVFGIIFILISCCVIRSKRSTQIREAVAKESMKYYNRSSVPCSWRLHANQLDTSAFYSRHRSHGICQLVIDIGSSMHPGYGHASQRYNQVGPEPGRNFSPTSNPPAYGQATGKY